MRFIRKLLFGNYETFQYIRNKTQRKAFLVFTDDQGNFSFTNGKVTLRVLFPLSKSNRENDLKVTRLTAAKYLDVLAEDGFLRKEKIGRSNYFINTALYSILTKEYN